MSDTELKLPPRTQEEIATIADAEKEAGVVDPQAAGVEHPKADERK